MKPPDENEPKLARDWTVSRVQRCLDSADKQSLILFIEERYRERFFQPIKRLMESPDHLQGYGFAIMALCSLLIESLQCYRYGLPTTYEREYATTLQGFTPPREYEIDRSEHKTGEAAFKDFFEVDDNRALFPGVDGKVFYKVIRNGLLHQAQTKQGWRIRSGHPKLWDNAEKVVDRTKFANALDVAFDKYVEELKAAAWDDDVWLKVRRKIWWLIQISR
jgi:hypothetical protein